MSPYVNHDPKDCGIDYKDPDVLERLYYDEGLSTREIGEKAGVTHSTVQYHMEKHGVDRKDRIEATREKRLVDTAAFYTDTSGGYEKWVGDKSVRVHRLLAVAKYGFDAVCGSDVHHINGVPWDNRPENLSLMGHGEHTTHHHTGKKQSRKLTESDVREIHRRVMSGDTDFDGMADDFGVTYRTILQVKNGDSWAWVYEDMRSDA